MISLEQQIRYKIADIYNEVSRLPHYHLPNFNEETAEAGRNIVNTPSTYARIHNQLFNIKYYNYSLWLNNLNRHSEITNNNADTYISNFKAALPLAKANLKTPKTAVSAKQIAMFQEVSKVAFDYLGKGVVLSVLAIAAFSALVLGSKFKKSDQNTMN